MKPFIYLTAGAAASAAIIVACSDDSPQNADAATCDCPAAESPITATRLIRVDDTRIAAANAGGGAFAMCPLGALLVGGSCFVDEDNTARELSLTFFGMEPRDPTMPATSWICAFDNKSLTATATVRAQALCLTPAR